MNFTIFIDNLTTNQNKEFIIPSESFTEGFRAFVKTNQEYIVQYSEGFIDEHTNVIILNNHLLKLNELMKVHNLEEKIVKVMLYHALDISEVIQLIENESFVVRNNVDDWSDIAEQYVEEHDILLRIPEDLREYFDFEFYGRNLMTGSYRFWNSFKDSISIQIL